MVLRDLVGMVDFAMIDAAGVDVEMVAQILTAHHRTFEVPAGRAAAPGAVPFHLTMLVGSAEAPDREVSGMTLARDAVDAALHRAFVARAGETAVVGDGTRVEVQAIGQTVAMLVGDRFAERDHAGDMVGRQRKAGGVADVEVLQVRLECPRVMVCDGPDILAALLGCGLHLVIARVGVAGQMADVGDVDDMSQAIALPRQGPAERIGEQIGAQIAEVRVMVDRRPARIDAHVGGVGGLEQLRGSGQAVVQRQRRHARAIAWAERCRQAFSAACAIDAAADRYADRRGGVRPRAGR